MKRHTFPDSRDRLSTTLAHWLIGAAILLVSFQANAEDKKKTEATGTWKWTQRPRGGNGQPFEMTLKLKQDGEKLTGVQFGRGGEVPIRDGIIHEGKVSFKVVPEFGGGNFVFKYEGALKEDTIEGKVESNFGGEPQTRDWTAKREAPKVKQPVNLTGTWQWSFTTPGGQTFEPRLRFVHAGDKLSGAVVWGENEAAISEASIEEEQVSFKVVRERDGRKVTTRYRGKLSGDTIQGKMESDWNGDSQTFDWSAKKVSGQP